MFYHIQINLPPKAAKEALKFIMPHRVNDIEKLNTSNVESFRNDTNDLTALKDWLGEMSSVVDTMAASDPSVRIVNKLETGHTLHGMVRFFISTDGDEDYSLGMDFNVRVADCHRYLSQPDSKFSMDLLADRWMVEHVASGYFYQRLNDTPLGIEEEGIINIHNTDLQADTKTACLILSLMPEARFHSNMVEEELINVARDQCERYKVMTADDIDFLDDELRFLVRGNHHELSL